MPSQSIKLQLLLFQQIKTKIGNQSLAYYIAPIINLRPSTIYKKLRGERPLTFKELILLTEHFDISIDQLVKEV